MPPVGKTSSWRNKLERSLQSCTNFSSRVQKTCSAPNQTNRHRTNQKANSNKYNVDITQHTPNTLETDYSTIGARGNISSQRKTHNRAKHITNNTYNNTNWHSRNNRPQLSRHKLIRRGHQTHNDWSYNHRQHIYPQRRSSIYETYWLNLPQTSNITHTSKTGITLHPRKQWTPRPQHTYNKS
jgi:hypothetical protein